MGRNAPAVGPGAAGSAFACLGLEYFVDRLRHRLGSLIQAPGRPIQNSPERLATTKTSTANTSDPMTNGMSQLMILLPGCGSARREAIAGTMRRAGRGVFLSSVWGS
jgi:hypothetical protein